MGHCVEFEVVGGIELFGSGVVGGGWIVWDRVGCIVAGGAFGRGWLG